jgi:hypothetical protein
VNCRTSGTRDRAKALRHHPPLALIAPLDLDAALLQAARRQGDAPGDADQVGVLELDPRAQAVAIVVEDVDPGRRQLP